MMTDRQWRELEKRQRAHMTTINWTPEDAAKLTSQLDAAGALLAVCREYIDALGPGGYHPNPGALATARMRLAIAQAEAAGIKAGV